MRTPRAAASTRSKKRAAPTQKAPMLSLAPALPPSVTDVINSWSPRPNTLEAKHWQAIAPDVRAHLLAQKIQGPALARKYIRTLARHAAARFDAGHQIAKAEELFSDAALTTSLAPALSSGAAPTARTADLTFLRRMRANLLPDLYGKNKDLIQPRHAVAKPYTQAELAALLSFARQDSTPLCLHLLAALLLSLGAGLTGAELMNARGSDLISTPWGLFIDTQGLSSKGNRGPRQVPIRALFEDELSKLAKLIGDDLFLGQPLQSGLRKPAALQPAASKVPHFSAYRARNTWMKALLEDGAPFIALRQAGVPVASDKHLATLSKGLELAFDKYISSLRQGAAPFDQSKHQHLFRYAQGQ